MPADSGHRPPPFRLQNGVSSSYSSLTEAAGAWDSCRSVGRSWLNSLQEVVNVGLVWLAVVGVAFSIIGAFYYIRIVKLMYFDHPLDVIQFRYQYLRRRGDNGSWSRISGYEDL